MFRAQANVFDEVVVKATDENLTSENWEYILDVCDRVSSSPTGPQQVIASLIRRLAHRNANVQLYTLELANALSQNCGAPLHRELASRSFTDALLRLAADRNTHTQVKAKVMERMGEWSEMFKGNPDLGIMEQAFGKLRSQNPGLQAPSKPGKREISSEDRRKEDEELQMALALSIKDKQPASAIGTGSRKVRDDSEPQPAQAQPGAAQGTTAATVSRVRALYDFTPSEAGELAFRKNDIIAVLESVYKDWWKGSLRGQTGIFPLNYVEKLQDPTREELERDAMMEGEVFAEIKNVEKLLALLSVRGEGGGGARGGEGEEEISELYQRTLSIRPKLIELIGKYSQKKDDFTQLNEKFIKARRDYETLLESSMAQPQYPIRPRQSSQPLYPASQYGGQGYPPQGSAASQAYPPQGHQPQQPYAAQSQQHLPPQQDPQRFYSPAPSEPPSNYGYNSQTLPPQNGPAPFMFIPGGVQQPSQQDSRQRTPKPSQPPQDPYGNPQPGFNGVVRPQSIHTLNSGNPQELATGGYESPIDNRHSYPPAQMGSQQPPLHQQQYDTYPPQQNQQQAPLPPQQQQYDTYPPQQNQQQAPLPPQQQRTDRDTLPSRQRTHSFESPASSMYTPQQDGPYPSLAGGQPHVQAYQPPQPSGAPPGVPGSPDMAPQYQAYQPVGQRAVSQDGSAGPDDYYR